VEFAVEMKDPVTGECGVGLAAIVPVWVKVEHLPSICASIDATNTETKVHCIYRLACLCKEFKKILCEDTALHETLNILGASKFSQVMWMEKRANTFHLWRYVLGKRTVYATLEEGREHDIQRFLASDGTNPYCALVASISATDFENHVRGAGRDVSEILSEIDDIAAQRRAEHLAHADFLGRIPEISLRLLGLATQYLNNQNAVQNTLDLMQDYYVQHIAIPEAPSQDLRRRLNVLSGALAVKVNQKGGKGIKKKATELHESFVVNGWYLLVRVTQHAMKEEESVSLHATLEKDRIVYPVNMKDPIKVLIRNIGRNATENDDDCGRRLVIKNPNDSQDEFVTHDRTEVTFTIQPKDKLEINCDIDEVHPELFQKIKSAVLRIVLQPK